MGGALLTVISEWSDQRRGNSVGYGNELGVGVVFESQPWRGWSTKIREQYHGGINAIARAGWHVACGVTEWSNPPTRQWSGTNNHGWSDCRELFL